MLIEIYNSKTCKTYSSEQIIPGIIKHFKDNKRIYLRLLIITLIYVLNSNTAFADSAIDKKGKYIYKKIVNVGKWFIIGKGGFDIIQSASEGDTSSVKKKLFTYIFIYAALLILPWGLDQVDSVFNDM